MRISEITTANKPYIRIVKGKKKIDIPITPKFVMLPPNKLGLKKYAFVGCENVRVKFKGKIVKINWAFNHNKMTLYCSSGHKAYAWNNVKVATITNAKGKKEQLVVCKREFGDETERRKYKRYPMIKRVIITQGNASYEGATMDISYNGLGIAVDRNARINPTEPLNIDFGNDTRVRARLVRTVFREDGTEFLGCHVSNMYRTDMVKLVAVNEAKSESKQHDKEKDKEKDTDKGWYEGQIKRWH